MQPLRRTKRLLLALAPCLTFNGCVVSAAVDLAATTVLTAGRLVIKGTGAVIDVAILGGKKDKGKKKEKSKEKSKSEGIIYKEGSSGEVTQ